MFLITWPVDGEITATRAKSGKAAKIWLWMESYTIDDGVSSVLTKFVRFPGKFPGGTTVRKNDTDAVAPSDVRTASRVADIF
jgi:hypothetical protein